MKRKKLSDELVKYGYVFSLPKMLVTYLVMVISSILIGLFFQLSTGFIIALCISTALMLPLYIKNYNYNRYQQQRFSDVNVYMEQFMYSFMKTGKILSTLTDVRELFSKGKMLDVIEKSIKHIKDTYEESDVEAKALEIVEKEYNYEGLKTMHGFALSVEANGGAYISCMQLILEARRMWADRVYEQMKIRRHQKVLVLMSIITSLLLCSVLYYMSDRKLREMRSFETVKKLSWNAEGGGQIVKSSATKNTIRRKEVETKARTRVDDINDFIKLLIGKSSEIKALWKEETQTVINVFIRASLPRRMRISEINSCIKSLFKLLKQRKFRAIIQCYGFRVDSFKRP